MLTQLRTECVGTSRCRSAASEEATIPVTTYVQSQCPPSRHRGRCKVVTSLKVTDHDEVGKNSGTNLQDRKRFDPVWNCLFEHTDLYLVIIPSRDLPVLPPPSLLTILWGSTLCRESCPVRMFGPRRRRILTGTYRSRR